MADDPLTRHVVEQLDLPPTEPPFFDQMWLAIEEDQRVALKRWRWRGLVLVALALAATGSAAAMVAATKVQGARTVEGTFSCLAQPRAGTHTVEFGANVEIAKLYPSAAFYLWSVNKIIGRQVISQLSIASDQTAVELDRHACRPIQGGLPLSGSGLNGNGTITPDFVGAFQEVCKLNAPRVLVHYRVSLQAQGATRARISLRADDRRRTPVGYVDWQPARVTSFVSPRCTPK